jgi:hypothetical protein
MVALHSNGVKVVLIEALHRLARDWTAYGPATQQASRFYGSPRPSMPMV